jgi:molybdenum cofactor synthesis domain-containing protein
MRAALLTVSTSKARGEGADESGARLAELVAGLGLEIAAREIVADERGTVEERLRHFCDELGVDLVLTSGGTGLSPDDITPEATRAVLDREAPGIAEAMRAASRRHSSHWMLSRGVAGTRGRTLIVNFPGSPRSIGQCGEAIADALPHALALLGGERPAHHAS